LHTPNRMQELTSYGEYIINLFAVTHRSLTPVFMDESLPLTKQCGSESGVSETSSCRSSRSLPTSKLRTWTQSEYPSPPKVKQGRRGSVTRTGRSRSLVTSGTMESVTKRKRTVEDDMYATSAKRQDTGVRSAALASQPEPDSTLKRPRYLRRSVWSDPDVSSFMSPTVCSTLTDDPLPRLPLEEFSNLDAVSTIDRNPHLFKIVTPIKVHRFEELLVGHPNRVFVESVCTSLRDGFWPWAHTQKESYPVTWDFSDRPPKTEHEADFLRGGGARETWRLLLAGIPKASGRSCYLGCTVHGLYTCPCGTETSFREVEVGQ
jgi:hypothetical protein